MKNVVLYFLSRWSGKDEGSSGMGGCGEAGLNHGSSTDVLVMPSQQGHLTLTRVLADPQRFPWTATLCTGRKLPKRP